VWNTNERHLAKSGAYLPVTEQDIPHSESQKSMLMNGLERFGTWTENPRVGGSIPPLATMKSMV
jgi:hypothetical protein